jgi:hypothetical protein
METKVVGRIFKIESPDGAACLLVEIKIDCPFCGEQVIEVAGHHLKVIRDILIEAIDLHPELTGPEARVIDSYTMKAQAPKDPSRN